MDFAFRRQQNTRFRQRFTPNKELRSEIDSVNFSFADWKPFSMKRSPSSFEVSKRPLIKNFYKKEQRKLFNVHRSFDCRKKENLDEVSKMNEFIRRVINGHTELRPKFLENREIEQELLENNDPTPHFIEVKCKKRFPREVFSLNTKKIRGFSIV